MIGNWLKQSTGYNAYHHNNLQLLYCITDMYMGYFQPCTRILRQLTRETLSLSPWLEHLLRKTASQHSAINLFTTVWHEFLQHLHHCTFITKHTPFWSEMNGVFLGCTLCVVPSTSSVTRIWCLAQSAASLRSACPNNLNIPFFSPS